MVKIIKQPTKQSFEMLNANTNVEYSNYLVIMGAAALALSRFMRDGTPKGLMTAAGTFCTISGLCGEMIFRMARDLLRTKEADRAENQRSAK
jgi:hypothetical protein